jgi:hypothetical protein
MIIYYWEVGEVKKAASRRARDWRKVTFVNVRGRISPWTRTTVGCEPGGTALVGRVKRHIFNFSCSTIYQHVCTPTLVGNQASVLPQPFFPINPPKYDRLAINPSHSKVVVWRLWLRRSRIKSPYCRTRRRDKMLDITRHHRKPNAKNLVIVVVERIIQAVNK